MNEDDNNQETYEAVQAVLLNSEDDPDSEIRAAVRAVFDFAEGEGDGMTEKEFMNLVAEVLLDSRTE